MGFVFQGKLRERCFTFWYARFQARRKQKHGAQPGHWAEGLMGCAHLKAPTWQVPWSLNPSHAPLTHPSGRRLVGLCSTSANRSGLDRMVSSEATENGGEGRMEAPFCRSPNQFKTEHLMWSKKNADRRPSLGWQWESRERGKKQRSGCKAETGRIFWAKESYLHLLFTKQLQIRAGEGGLEASGTNIMQPEGCWLSQKQCLPYSCNIPATISFASL